MKRFYILSVICLLACAGLAAAQEPPAPADQNSAAQRYRIGYQDTLEVQVFRHPELSRRVAVNPNGTINLFKLDRPILAVCKTESELARDIAAAYAKDYLRNPEVSVVAVDQKSQYVAVLGAVVKPGNFYITRPVQLLELLAYAGGPDPEKAGSRILVARMGSNSNCRTPENDAAAVAAAAGASSDIQLFDFRIKDVREAKQRLVMQPGDIVFVSDADQVYVYGNVNKQKAVKMKEPITLVQAIAEAEGAKSASNLGSVRVLRQKPNSSEREELVYNVKSIVAGKQPDPFLEPNDIVAISEDKAKSIINSIGRSLTGGVGSIFYRVPAP
ncbi:MAG: polysaccharide biosynthesis/export family protein [Pyrinomonadaceae bacterium]